MTRTKQQAAALFYSMAVLTACASQTPRDFTPRPQTGLSAISTDEILSSTGTNAYELVERMRPLYLTTSVDLAPTAEREVYLNGVRLGGLSQLRGIPARDVKDIRFVRAIDGIVYGVGRSGGAILVTSKAGR
jgi:hypothetical protein